jgi:hypothetical protein
MITSPNTATAVPADVERAVAADLARRAMMTAVASTGELTDAL